MVNGPDLKKTLAFPVSRSGMRGAQKMCHPSTGRPRRCRVAALVGLALAACAAGGLTLTVGAGLECHVEASTAVETSNARNGPKGTAAEYGWAIRKPVSNLSLRL
jgi:hypothetical protein